jgi:hypothetical protein
MPKTTTPQTTKAAPTATSAAPARELVEFYREIATLPAKARLDRLISRKDTMRVVRQMPTLDLYATVRDVGIEDALEVLELMSPAQVQGFLDLDGWRKDRVDPAAMARWVRTFFAANVERAVGQLRGLDIELLTLLIKIHCRVYDLTLDEQPEEEVGRHTMTPDGRFLIVFGGVGGDDDTLATIQQFLERLMARDMLFVLRLCESLRWELPSSLEEEALRWRHARLADLGFLPAEDAATIFAWLDPEQALTMPAPPSRPVPPSADDAVSTDLTSSPLLPWDLLGEGASVLSKAIAGLDAGRRDRVHHELMLVANRVHASDAADLGDSDALKETVRHVTSTAGTGLAWLAQGDESQLAARLTTTNVQHLFRVGHSLALKLRSELRSRVGAPRSGLTGRGLLRLDAPLREVVAGFLRVRPLLFGGLVHPQRVDYRPVAGLGELAAAAAALTEAAFRASLLEGLGAHDAVFADLDDAALPPHAAILGAWLGRALLGRVPEVAPLASADVDQLKVTIATAGPAVDTALAALDDRVRAFAPLPGAADGDAAVTRARTYARQVLDATRDELLALKGQHVDGRFLQTVWTR